MSKLLVCQHVPFELLGTLNPLLKSYGYRIRYVNFGRHPHARPSLDGYRGLIVLGGPMGVDDSEAHPHLLTEQRLIECALQRDLPVLGICLGAQLVARTLGARVERSPSKEIGWYDVALTEEGRADPVFAPFGPTERVFQWHGDAFDVPCGAVRLASSEGCPNQAFRYGDAVYGLQFHLEADESLIERWLTVPVHLAEIESLGGGVDPEGIRRETRRRIGAAKRLADAVFSQLVRIFGERPRRGSHPHR